MKLLILGLMTCAVVGVGCSKVDSSSSGPGTPGAPSAEPLAPGFKNSAKNSSEVGSKLKSFSSSTKTSMSLPGSAPASTTSTLAGDAITQFATANLSSIRNLTSAALTSSDSESDASDINVMTALMDIEVNGDCGAAMKKLSTLYDKKYSELSKYAQYGISYDGKLPAGTSRAAATDQYAAVYTQVDSDGQAATMGFGANSEKALMGVTFVGQITDSDDSSKKTNATGEMLYVATMAQKKLEESMNIKLAEGTIKIVSTTIGGDTPSIAITQDVVLDAGKASGSVKITKTSANEMQIDGSETKNGVVTNSSLKLSVDKSGKCVAAQK